MIFQVTNGYEYLVGEVNKINELLSGGKKIIQVDGSNGVFVLNGSKLAWDDEGEFPSNKPLEEPVSITEKFLQVDGRLDDLEAMEDDVAALDVRVAENRSKITDIETKLNTDSNFLSFDANGLHSNLGLRYNADSGLLEIIGNDKEGVPEVVASSNLTLASEIHYAGVHVATDFTGSVVTWQPALPNDGSRYVYGENFNVEVGAPHLVIGYVQAHGDQNEVLITAASLTRLVDIYTAGNGLTTEVDNPNQFKVVGGDGIDVDADGVHAVVDTKTGMNINTDTGKIQFTLNSFETLSEAIVATNGAPDGTLFCVYDPVNDVISRP